MNALVASVIRTYTPIIVGQLAAWLIMIHIPVLPELEVLITAVVGGLLSAAYYTVVRVLEQQWPSFGILLGLTASPDTYSKGNAAPDTSAVPENPSLGAAALTDALDRFTAPTTTFPKDAVAAAEAAVVPAAPVPVVPVFEAPVAAGTIPTV